MMMHYFYHLDYPHIPLYEQAADKADSFLPSASDSTAMEPSKICAPDPWGFEESSTPTRRNLKKPKKPFPRGWVGLDTATPIRDPNLIIHANVYALGEQYGVEGLKAVALQKFSKEVDVHWATDDFLQAAELVYNSTPEHDRGMRDVIKNTFYRHRRELLDRENVKRYLRDVTDLAYDVLMHLYKEGV